MVIIAYALSRAIHLDDPTPEGNAENQIELSWGTEERWKFAGYPTTVHSMSPETKPEILEGNKSRTLQDADEVWKEVIKWVMEGRTPKLSEVQGKVQELRQLFNTISFVIHNGVL